jgi:hypothetical protein
MPGVTDIISVVPWIAFMAIFVSKDWQVLATQAPHRTKP